MTTHSTSKKRLTYTDFDHEAVMQGTKPLTPEERAFLIEDTPNFEEGMHLTSEGLAQLSDADLMREAYNVWADYASTQ